MENEKFNKKDLKKRLACVMLIYMDNLDGKKKERLRKYLESRLGEEPT